MKRSTFLKNMATTLLGIAGISKMTKATQELEEQPSSLPSASSEILSETSSSRKMPPMYPGNIVWVKAKDDPAWNEMAYVSYKEDPEKGWEIVNVFTGELLGYSNEYTEGEYIVQGSCIDNL